MFANDYFPGDIKHEMEVSVLMKRKFYKLFKINFEDSATMSAVLISDGYIVKEKAWRGV